MIEERHLADLAAAGSLLVACDFDGTLAPIVDNPDAATALPDSVEALRRLKATDNTAVAIISGRRRDELATRFGDDFVLIGEHGADPGTTPPSDPPSLTLARRKVDAAHAETPGSRAEHKPRSVVFHYRRVDDPDRVVARLRSEGERLDGITVLEGKSVLELTTSPVDKGDALVELRRIHQPDRVLFLGDDVTDESVFERLGPHDLGVKVGSGRTAAVARVTGPEDVAELLRLLADRRGA